jgi:hypothetical protein
MAQPLTLEEWLEDPEVRFGPSTRPVAAPREVVVFERDEDEPGPQHPWRGAYDRLHRRARQLLRRYRRETGARGVFSVDIAGFANWALGLRIDCVGASWRSYAHWAREAIRALPATAEERERAKAILREEPGAATAQEVVDREAHASKRAAATKLRQRALRRRKKEGDCGGDK